MSNYGNSIFPNPQQQNNMSYANFNEGIKTNQLSGVANDPQSATAISSPQPNISLSSSM